MDSTDIYNGSKKVVCTMRHRSTEVARKRNKRNQRNKGNQMNGPFATFLTKKSV